MGLSVEDGFAARRAAEFGTMGFAEEREPRRSVALDKGVVLVMPLVSEEPRTFGGDRPSHGSTEILQQIRQAPQWPSWKSLPSRLTSQLKMFDHDGVQLWIDCLRSRDRQFEQFRRAGVALAHERRQAHCVMAPMLFETESRPGGGNRCSERERAPCRHF